ncbi:MAG: TIGR00282 family metallophosphoesterase [Pseudomonadota bacterium]|nr:TIGR00282 family metallophosphoesterase [Pseudomonadota bacterium]
MNILICGDIVGRPGRDVVEKFLPGLIEKNEINFVIVNGENSANGFGITKKICEQLYSMGVDVITTGNHVWDQKEIVSYINNDNRLLRPCNFLKDAPGRGYGVYKLKSGDLIVVINVMCRLFMDNIEDPFNSLIEMIEDINLKYGDQTIIVDVHGESTSEKMALGHFLDGKVSAIFGTHTHIPTADLHILEKGTFYQTDLGMCGDYNSVIGMKKDLSIQRFTKKFLKTKLEPASGEGTLCGTLIKIDSRRKVIKFEQIIKGGKLEK